MAQVFTVIQGGLSATPAGAFAVRSRRLANGQITLVWSRDVQIAPEIRRDVGPSQPVPVFVDDAAIAAVDRAIRLRLAALRAPLRLVGAVEEPNRPLRANARPAGLRMIPAQNLLGVRPEGRQKPAAIAMAAHHDVPVPAVGTASPRAARARGEDILRRIAEFVIGTLQLGSAPAALAWRRARG